MNELLLENQIDICGMQEVPGIKKLCAAVDQSIWSCHFDDAYFSYGTGLIFRKDKFDLLTKKTHTLKASPGKKTAFEVRLREKVTNQEILIFVTHLDHKTEEQRFKEWRVLEALLPSDEPHILLGDFNSLRRSDYTDEELAVIEKSRKESNWEAPTFELIDEIEKKYQDALSLSNGVQSTCRFLTRVDYIFTFGLAQNSSFVIDSLKTSDHQIVALDFNLDFQS
jgi:endonuclease/exonuclease/phosphatase family metal-dependent hydrolase